MGYFCPKIHLSKKYIYTEDLSNITFNYLSKNSPNYLCHFWNHKSIFTKQLLCIILAQTLLYILYTSSPSKFKFSDFPLLELKFTKFLMSFFKQKISFSSKFGSFFSVMRDHFSVLFYIAGTLYAINKSSTSKCKCSDLPLLPLKFTKLLMSFLEPRVSFSPSFVSLCSVMRCNSSVLFYLNLYMLWTKEAHQSAHFQTSGCSHEN